MNSKLHMSHGELNFFKTDKPIPEGAKLLKPKDGRYIVADSETTGNHHCIEEAEDVEIFEHDGKKYMKNSRPAKIFCVIESRHDTIKAPPGVWEIEPSFEYDYLTEEIRHCRD